MLPIIIFTALDPWMPKPQPQLLHHQLSWPGALSHTWLLLTEVSDTYPSKRTQTAPCREPVRHSTRDKGHEEGASTYAKVGSSLRSPPRYSRASTPQKTRVCLLYCFVLSPLTLLGAVPHHHLALSVKELTYSSN